MSKRGFCLAAVLLLGCGKELAAIPFSGEGVGDASVSLTSGQTLALWTKLDASWDGTFTASYDVELRDASGKAVGSATCDPLTPTTKIASMVTNMGGHHTASYRGKMQCSLTAPSAGTFTVHAKLRYGTKPSVLTVKDISLLIKT